MEHKEKIQLFYVICFAYIFGILIASFFPQKANTNEFIFFCIFICAIVLATVINIKKVRLLLIISAVTFFSFWFYIFNLPKDSPSKIWHYNDKVITFYGIVNKEVDTRATNQKLEISVISIINNNIKKVSGKVLVTTEPYTNYEYGEELEIACELKKPEAFSGFDYDRYLARYDIFSVCYYPKIIKIENSRKLSLIQTVYKNIFLFKNRLREIINNGLSQDEANLAKAIILGDKNSLSAEWKNIFSASGISHIVAISGMHISIISSLVMAFLISIGLKRKHAFYVAIIFLASYIIIIGSPASAMRAGLMGFCVLWALKLGRISKLINSLLLAAVILLLINPYLIRDDVGFQLSFLAVLGISYIFPRIKKFFEKILNEKIFNLKIVQVIIDILGITVAAQVFTMPIIYYNFEKISLVAPLTNLLVLWTLPFLMIFLLVGLFLGLIFPAWLIVIFLPAKILLSYILFISHLLGTWRYAIF